jgi:hypothetical protein
MLLPRVHQCLRGKFEVNATCYTHVIVAALLSHSTSVCNFSYGAWAGLSPRPHHNTSSEARFNDIASIKQNLAERDSVSESQVIATEGRLGRHSPVQQLNPVSEPCNSPQSTRIHRDRTHSDRYHLSIPRTYPRWPQSATLRHSSMRPPAISH